MTEAFSAYIKTIAAVTIFAAFTEMLMPDNSFKKYINLVTGLLLLTVVLRPMFSLFQEPDGTLEERLTQRVQRLSGDTGLQEQQYYETLQQDTVEKVYEQELNEQITADIQNEFGEKVVVEAQFDQNRDSENYGNVLAVHISGFGQKGEELKTYMEKSYHIASDCISINFDP